MKEMLIMTPGPTEVAENVRLARAKATTNPDIAFTKKLVVNLLNF